jgi:hypothetical protein
MINRVPSKAVLQADLEFITTVLESIEQAARVRQEQLNLPVLDYVSNDLTETRNTLLIRKAWLENCLARIELMKQ